MDLSHHSVEAARGNPEISRVDGWMVHSYASVTSTNLVAADLPVWHAVRSISQTSGRGRFQRTWVSDAGGLWLSAVVPTESSTHCLPLLIGLAVCKVLNHLGVPDVRMRWPNDILVGNGKLAGLLIDQFQSGRAIAGIGINVLNHPEKTDPELAGQTSRLGDLVKDCPGLDKLTALLLGSVRQELGLAARDGFDGLLPNINALWGDPRPVELDLDGIFRRGTFLGVDPEGRLLLSNFAGEVATFQSHQVRHLQEL